MARSQWGSRLGFILAAAGSAIGLGAIWKFPYVAATNGGGAFLFIYLGICLTLGLALMVSEMALGRAANAGAVGAFRKLAGGFWPVIGYMGVLVCFLILSFYSVVGGWTVAYIVKSLQGSIMTSDPKALGAIFTGFISDPVQPVLYHGGFALLTLAVVVGGVQKGIEALSKFLMPALFVLMLVLIARGLTLPGALEGVSYFVAPDFSKVSAAMLVDALGLAFFSLSLGLGIMITYGSYVGRESKLVSSALWVIALTVATCFLAGLMVLPAVFAFGFDPSAGPGLTFITMPAVFAHLPLGQLFAVMFFCLLLLAALTSSVSLLEVVTSFAIDELRLSRRAAADLAELESAATQGVVWQGGDAIRALGRQLRAHQGIPHCKLPPGFTATLRPYQQHGLNWLQLLASAGLGGVLADDMGLGKTVQALAHIAVEQDTGRLDRPALVVCPTSLIPNWRAEAARFAPTLRTLVLHGPDRAQLFPAIPRHDLVITTYPLLTRDHAVLVEQPWHLVILDEAQTIKNPLATTSKLARTLRARQRLCLSGTPLENHLGELWSLFDFLAPGLLGDQKSFGRRFRTPIEKNGDADRQALLARRVAPFLLRRTKAEVAADLPPKTEIAEPVDMEPAQRAIYEAIRIAMHAKVRAAVAKRGLGGAGIIILDALLKLRQACCDPRLVKLASAKSAKAGSAKLDRLLEMLPQLLEQGRRILLFSQFTAMLALIQTELDRMQIPYVLLTGDTKDRTTPVKRFQSGAVPLFLISLKAGGTGLNLTAADTVIHYDPWWNPAVEDQATDRAHRIGQDKPVFVHRLITTGTIEEKMETLKQRKQALAAGILGAAGGTAAGLQEADLEMLFG